MKGNRKDRLLKAQGWRRSRRAKPETPPLRKPGGDIIRELVERGVLGPGHLDVALEIRAVHQAVGRGMFPTTHIDEVRDRRGKRGAPVPFFERMTAAERKLWERNYMPWCRAIAVDVLTGLPGVRWLELVIAIVVDNVSFPCIERRYRLANGKALDYLKAGLECYPGYGTSIRPEDEF